MGCIVNGPVRQRMLIWRCARQGEAFIYRKGKKIAAVSESRIVPNF